MKKTNKTYKFLISGGGTGGHIFPALSIARTIREKLPDAEILFAGAEGRMEMQRVPQAGFEIVGLPIAGLQRKLTLKNLSLPLKVVKSISKALELLKNYRPDAVIGTGGYASAPVVWAAQFKNIPTFIQEQNSYPGITNRFLGRKARKIFTAYDEAARYFPKDKIILTGNPVRPEIAEMQTSADEGRRHFQIRSDKPVVLVLGGSLGAAAINRAVAEMIKRHGDEMPFHLLWQTGKLYYDRYKDLEEEHITILPFIQEMDKAYAAADLIISRAGAGTLSELALAGKPVILIPSKNVSEDHQTKNAMALVRQNAAEILPENDIHRLYEQITALLDQPEKRQQMAENIRKTARPRAAEEIVEHILKELGIET